MRELGYPQQLADDVVRLRPWRLDDADCVDQAGQDPSIPSGTTVPAVYSAEAGAEYIRRQHGRLTSGQGVSMAIARVADDVAVGMLILQVRPQPDVAGIGYWIVPGARRRGYARRAVALATDWGLDQHRGLGLARIEAWVDPENTASQHVLQAAGYLLEGRLRSFLEFAGHRCDMLVLSKVVGDP